MIRLVATCIIVLSLYGCGGGGGGSATIAPVAVEAVTVADFQSGQPEFLLL